MNINTQRALALALAFFCGLSLAGCGGGGGGGGSTARAAPVLPPIPARFTRGTLDQQLDRVGVVAENQRESVREQARTAAAATPRVGSITQSSNVDGGNVTLDQIEVSAGYTSGTTYTGGNLRLSVTNANGRSGSLFTVGTADTVLLSADFKDDIGRLTDTLRTVTKETAGGGTVIVDAYTNHVISTNTDYYVGGVWLFLPPDANDDPQIGAFFDSPYSLTPASYLQTSGSATYEGHAGGTFLEVKSNGETEHGVFRADAKFTATFGSSPTISGELTEVVDLDTSRAVVNGVVDQARVLRRPLLHQRIGSSTLTLGQAAIRTTAGGFFSGDTHASGTHGVTTYTYRGKWGGHFYGPPDDVRIGGTLGATGSGNDDDYELTLMGFFAAEPPQE